MDDIEYERPSLEQIQAARIERHALALANGASEGKIGTRISQEIPDQADQVTVMKLVRERAEVLHREQKRRYLVFGSIWVLVGAVPLVVGLLLSAGTLLLLTAGPIAYGVYLLTRKGSDPSEYDQMG